MKYLPLALITTGLALFLFSIWKLWQASQMHRHRPIRSTWFAMRIILTCGHVSIKEKAPSFGGLLSGSRGLSVKGKNGTIFLLQPDYLAVGFDNFIILYSPLLISTRPPDPTKHITRFQSGRLAQPTRSLSLAAHVALVHALFAGHWLKLGARVWAFFAVIPDGVGDFVSQVFVAVIVGVHRVQLRQNLLLAITAKFGINITPITRPTNPLDNLSYVHFLSLAVLPAV